jgi:predicted transcriptional regulator of viral defense system
MIGTGISEKELQNLETALARYGAVVSFEQLSEVFREERPYLRKRISQFARKGWLFRIKKGVYVISDLHSRGSLSISQYAVVNLLVEPAYVSFESALQYHGFYDQLLSSVTSVATKQFQDKNIDGYTFSFVKTIPAYFYGWETHPMDGQSVKIASREKALIDLIQYHRSAYSVDLVLEKLSNFTHEFDLDKLVDLSFQSTIAVQRILGFVLDCLKQDSEKLTQALRKHRGTSKITDSDENVFNSKWRLYYDRYFERYV